MHQHRKGLGILVGFLVAGAVAWRLGDRAGVPVAFGVLSGYLFGAAVALWGVEYQKHVARTRPARLWQAFGVSFAVKFTGLAVGPLTLWFVPYLGERCDWRAFLLAYGFGALLVLLVGSAEIARALQPPTGTPPGDASPPDARVPLGADPDATPALDPRTSA